MLPALFLLVGIFLIPVAALMGVSVQESVSLKRYEAGFSFQGYARLFTDSWYLKQWGRTCSDRHRLHPVRGRLRLPVGVHDLAGAGHEEGAAALHHPAPAVHEHHRAHLRVADRAGQGWTDQLAADDDAVLRRARAPELQLLAGDYRSDLRCSALLCPHPLEQLRGNRLEPGRVCPHPGGGESSIHRRGGGAPDRPGFRGGSGGDHHLGHRRLRRADRSRLAQRSGPPASRPVTRSCESTIGLSGPRSCSSS